MLGRLDVIALFAGRVILLFTIGVLSSCAILAGAYELAVRLDEHLLVWASNNWQWPAVMAITLGAMVAATFDFTLARSDRDRGGEPTP